MFNSLTRLTVALSASLALAAPALAEAPKAPSSFERDGVSYTYTAVAIEGSTVIKGTANGRSFRLTVKDEQVKGTFDGVPVRFSLADVNSSASGLALR